MDHVASIIFSFSFFSASFFQLTREILVLEMDRVASRPANYILSIAVYIA